MADPAELSVEELEALRDQGAAIYMSAYLQLMARHLGVYAGLTDTDGLNAMAMAMVEPLNLATRAMWYALMNDHKLDEALFEFRESVSNLHP